MPVRIASPQSRLLQYPSRKRKHHFEREGDSKRPHIKATNVTEVELGSTSLECPRALELRLGTDQDERHGQQSEISEADRDGIETCKRFVGVRILVGVDDSMIQSENTSDSADYDPSDSDEASDDSASDDMESPPPPSPEEPEELKEEPKEENFFSSKASKKDKKKSKVAAQRTIFEFN
ncbi:uncharacterized protein PAC_03827 [Phialocephala subalpina]|uniref:Uncharacterized protein n=1 Tax=Phialocephala subalpina TaxID=576137 RepID=A0A1L7WMD5_9HELO|nr:uncharacterized protein PAC_03827 [Phialocephala subalpina]